MALYALGKLHAAVAAAETSDLPAAEPKAVVFYQASLLVCPRNYMAANDLGVVLAQSGYYAEARSALEHSVRISWQSANLGNLAVVYRVNWGSRGWPNRPGNRRKPCAALRSSGCGRGSFRPAARCSGSIRGSCGQTGVGDPRSARPGPEPRNCRSGRPLLR